MAQILKFNRAYRLTVQKNSTQIPLRTTQSTITIELPFTVELDINRNSYTSANNASIKVYNLSEVTRRELAHDEYDFSNYQQVILSAGYVDGSGKYPTIFRGNITKCQSVREGVDFVTTIEALDGGFAQNNASFDFPFPENTSRETIIKTMMQSLNAYKISVGAIGSFGLATNTPRGNSYSGDTIPLISDLTGGGVFIDLETINCLRDNEYIYFSDIPLINAASGLLGTPVRQQSFLTFDVLFEPKVGIGKVIRLESSSGFNYDGFYKVASVQHRGTISSAVCGRLVTSIGVPYVSGFQALTPVQVL